MKLIQYLVCIASGLALLLCVTPSEAALSILSLGDHTSGATTNTFSTQVNDCPVGSLVVVGSVVTTVADTLTSVTDNKGLTWAAPFDNIAGTGVAVAWDYAVNTANDLPVASQIVAHYSGATSSYVFGACISGAATTSPLDKSNNSANGLAATSATTVSTGTLAQAVEIILGIAGGATNSGAVTCAGSFTRTINGAGSTPSTALCSLIVSSTASVSFTPTWSNSVNYVTDLISFTAPVAATGKPVSFTTMGVGP